MFTEIHSRRGFLASCARWVSAVSAALALPAWATARQPFSDADLATLKERVSGKLIPASDAYFDNWLQGMSWQLRDTKRRPDLILQAESTDDVVEAVRFAAAQGIRIGVRSGGHSWVSSSIRDGGMLLDLGKFRSISVDADNMKAVVGPAVTARQLATELEKFGLGFPTAHCSTVALGGYLLGGGQAWNWGSWGGAACNSILGIEAVNADGEKIFVDRENHADLFWAARGSGPGFPAVVTNYHLQLYRLPQAIRLNSYMWPLADTLTVSEWLPKVGAVLSDKVELFMFLLGLPQPIQGQSKVVVITAVAFADTPAEAQELLAPMSEASSLAPTLLSEEMTPMTINSLLDLVDRTYPPCRAAVDTFWFDLSMRAVQEKFVEHFAAAPSAMTNVLCEVKPKPIRIPDGAYSMRRLTYLSPYSFWLDEKDDQANIAWMEKTQQILGPLAVGHYVNEADLEASPERSERSYREENWRRIGEIRAAYDPHGIFHTYLGH
jgi:FAD/FMN-containing dehydrogenase